MLQMQQLKQLIEPEPKKQTNHAKKGVNKKMNVGSSPKILAATNCNQAYHEQNGKTCQLLLQLPSND
jgi:hypothetical protein